MDPISFEAKPLDRVVFVIAMVLPFGLLALLLPGAPPGARWFATLPSLLLGSFVWWQLSRLARRVSVAEGRLEITPVIGRTVRVPWKLGGPAGQRLGLWIGILALVGSLVVAYLVLVVFPRQERAFRGTASANGWGF